MPVAVDPASAGFGRRSVRTQNLRMASLPDYASRYDFTSLDTYHSFVYRNIKT